MVCLYSFLCPQQSVREPAEYPRHNYSCSLQNLTFRMCESHIIYHLCGHVKITTIVQCADMVDRLIASRVEVKSTHHLCDDLSDNIHIFPDICKLCQQSGVVADWIDQQPGGKFQVLRAWKNDNKHPQQPSGAPAGDPQKTNDGAGKDDATESLSPITLSNSEENSSGSSTNPSISSSAQSVASSATLEDGKASDLSSIKARVAGLTTRTDRLLAKIRARKPKPVGASI